MGIRRLFTGLYANLWYLYQLPSHHLPHNLHLRGNRSSPKPDLNLTQEELVEIRASQRTFEGAYFRTSISLFTFSLIVLKIFTVEFYPIGALFAVYGTVVMGISAYRRSESNRQFYIVEDKEDNELPADQRQGTGKRVFRTSGNTVIVCAITSIFAYIVLIVLVLRLKVEPSPIGKHSIEEETAKLVAAGVV
ncbi:hypothetical protein ABW19_dt0205505 [Dactylella cylindrospora]|nr:hypothetical protein ABW19_dt0205505 [Dactylella cylindrospora]